MQISGLHKYSFLDYPGKMSCVIFIQGCNWKCSYCHNKQLWEERPGTIDKKDIFKFIKKRKNVLDGIVISGGEPTFGTNLLGFIKELKQFNLPIKLDTNGSFPDVLEEVLPYIDYVAMDIKTCLDSIKYSKVCGIEVNLADIKKSINLITLSKLPYHFRTTDDAFSKEDKDKLEKELDGRIHIFQCKR